MTGLRGCAAAGRQRGTGAGRPPVARRGVLRLGDLTVGPAASRGPAASYAPAPAPARSSGGGGGPLPTAFPNYGRSKGAPIRGASQQDLDYYANGARRSLADPSKARFHDKERALLEAIDQELQRQRGGGGGPESEEPPPPGARTRRSGGGLHGGVPASAAAGEGASGSPAPGQPAKARRCPGLHGAVCVVEAHQLRLGGRSIRLRAGGAARLRANWSITEPAQAADHRVTSSASILFR
jgi:hypothetical protein